MALPAYGTLTTLDTLASSYQSVVDFGEDRAWDAIAASLAAHNRVANDMMGGLVTRTTDRLRRYGNTASMKFTEQDEYGTPDAQKVLAGIPCGFPLRLYEAAVQWTYRYFLNAKASEIAAQFVALQDADILNLIRQIKIALFRATNYTFEDRLVDHLQQLPLPIKALLNADGAGIPPGPNGEVFDGTTHTHYLNNATLTDTWLRSVVETVIEHFQNGRPMLFISRANETAVRALASFTPYFDGRIQPALTTQYAVGQTLDPIQIYNRPIGIFNGAEVWVKPWMIQDYYFCRVDGMPAPLVMRVRDGVAGAGDLQVAFEDESHPLRCKGYEREFGVGAWTRTNGAIGYVGNGGGGYLVPTIA